MSKQSLLGSCEISINTALRRLTMLDGLNKKSLESEFKEWIRAIENGETDYEVLYLNRIKI